MTFCSILLTGLFVLLVLSSNFELVRSNKVGDLSTKSHGVSGAVYILDEKRIFIQGFSYDGKYFKINFMEQNKMFDDPGKVREELTPETTLK
jgi:hypothetical protein